MEYKSCQIEISVHVDRSFGSVTYQATYIISRDGKLVSSGTVAGDYKTQSEAEHEAEVAAKRWSTNAPDQTP